MSYTPSPLRSRSQSSESADRARRSHPAEGGRGEGGRAEGAGSAGARASGVAGRSTAATELEAHDDEEDGTDWGRVGAFGAGIALGALIGAGAALLMAPQSGDELRRGLRLRARSAKLDARDAWDDLGDQLAMLRRAARRKLRGQRRAARRSVTKGRWRLEDALTD